MRSPAARSGARSPAARAAGAPLRVVLGLAGGLLLAVAALVAPALAAPGGGRTVRAEAPPAGLAVATFAAGCFWCLEPPFDKTAGVVSTTSGYVGGSVDGATYEEVSRGGTGHTEAVRVVYDPAKVSYAKLLDVFWRNVDPVDARGQFCDKGSQYRPAIVPNSAAQKTAAEASLAAMKASGRFQQPIVVKVEPDAPFWVAEDYHQNYYKTNAAKYNYYRYACGRDARLKALWGDEAGGATQ